MDSKVQYLIEFSLQDGQQDTFKKLAGQAIEQTKKEPGTLNYQAYFNQDESKFFVMEQYADSPAAMQHLNNVTPILTELLQISSVSRLEVFGPMAEENRAVATSLGAVFYNHFDGFTR
ncbi:hypothetical protein BH11BAC5_BH11BAC5_19130 [soil metagenome]